MGIPAAELKRLFARSGNRCAFKDCRKLLIVDAPPGQPPVTLGDVAHIVAGSPAGPRGESFLSPSDRDKYDNLILLCNRHHQLIDAQPATFTSERVRSIKEDHERWVEQRLAAGVQDDPQVRELREDLLFSTLLPVTQMPRYVFASPCRFKTDGEVRARLGKLRRGEMAPYILRENRVLAFQNMRARNNPFADVVTGTVDRYRLEEWVEDPDRFLWLISLLNRSLNKLTGRRGLELDKDHHRYYFPLLAPGEPRYETYRPLNANHATLAVAWQPIRRSTGEPKKHWYHRAVALRFTKISDREWCLSVRPELRVTVDGFEPLQPRYVGSRVTRKKSRLYNYDLLKEVQFWRDFLSRSSPRIVFPFGSGGQRLVVLSDLMQGLVQWPGIPQRHAKPFRNVFFVDDLFSWAETELTEGGEEPQEIDWEEEAGDDSRLG